MAIDRLDSDSQYVLLSQTPVWSYDASPVDNKDGSVLLLLLRVARAHFLGIRPGIDHVLRGDGTCYLHLDLLNPSKERAHLSILRIP